MTREYIRKITAVVYINRKDPYADVLETLKCLVEKNIPYKCHYTNLKSSIVLFLQQHHPQNAHPPLVTQVKAIHGFGPGQTQQMTDIIQQQLGDDSKKAWVYTEDGSSTEIQKTVDYLTKKGLQVFVQPRENLFAVLQEPTILLGKRALVIGYDKDTIDRAFEKEFPE